MVRAKLAQPELSRRIVLLSGSGVLANAMPGEDQDGTQRNRQKANIPGGNCKEGSE